MLSTLSKTNKFFDSVKPSGELLHNAVAKSVVSKTVQILLPTPDNQSRDMAGKKRTWFWLSLYEGHDCLQNSSWVRYFLRTSPLDLEMGTLMYILANFGKSTNVKVIELKNRRRAPLYGPIFLQFHRVFQKILKMYGVGIPTNSWTHSWMSWWDRNTSL